MWPVAADTNGPNERYKDIAAWLHCHANTVVNIRKRFVEGGLDRALNEDPRPGQRRKLDGRGEAQLIAIACSKAPAGHDHWTVRLLAGKLVEMDVVESISHETVRLTLKKTN